MSFLHDRNLWIVLVIALSLRTAAACVVEQRLAGTEQRFLIPGDADGYWELGKRIAGGSDYAVHQPPRYVLRTPGYPLLLAAVIRIAGDSVFSASLVMAWIGTCCCGLTWVLGKRLVDQRTAVLAAAWMAVSPLQVGNSVLILSETWFAFWLLLCLIAFSGLPGRWQPGFSSSAAAYGDLSGTGELAGTAPGGRNPEVRNPLQAGRALVGGLVTGVAALVRPGWILWPGFSGSLLIAWGEGRVTKRCWHAALIGIGCLMALAPWAWRNQQVTGHWILTSLWSGPSLYDGLHPGATGASDMRFVDQEGIYGRMSEYAANAHYKQKAWEFVLAQPRRAVELGIIKAGRYLSLTPQAAGFSGGILSQACLVYYTAFGLMTILGAWQLRHRPALVLLLAGPFLQFLVVHMVFVGSIRYRLPVEFPLSVLAAAGTRRIRGV